MNAENHLDIYVSRFQMNESIMYIYLAIVMVVSLSTGFYVRTVKNKLDTKVDAMFKLVQSMAREINALKAQQTASPDKDTSVIQLDLNSNENKIVVSDAELSSSSSSYEDSDDENSESDEDIDNEENTSSIIKEFEVTKLDVDVSLDLQNQQENTTEENAEVENIEVENIDVVKMEEIKEINIEPLAEQNYEVLTVKELKELVTAKGGKVTGKKKADLIEYLSL